MTVALQFGDITRDGCRRAETLAQPEEESVGAAPIGRIIISESAAQERPPLRTLSITTVWERDGLVDAGCAKRGYRARALGRSHDAA